MLQVILGIKMIIYIAKNGYSFWDWLTLRKMYFKWALDSGKRSVYN